MPLNYISDSAIKLRAKSTSRLFHYTEWLNCSCNNRETRFLGPRNRAKDQVKSGYDVRRKRMDIGIGEFVIFAEPEMLGLVLESNESHGHVLKGNRYGPNFVSLCSSYWIGFFYGFGKPSFL